MPSPGVARPSPLMTNPTEGGGFEPPKRGLPACWFSRPVHSTALPPFRARHMGRLVDPPAASGGAQVIIQRPGMAADSSILAFTGEREHAGFGLVERGSQVGRSL